MMIFRSKKNRKRVDVTKKTAEIKAVASSLAPVLLRVVGAVFACIAMVFGANALFGWARQSPRFAITTLHFSGNVHASDAELSRVGAVQLGQNLFALDALAVERLIVANHPWVKTARANRHFPQTLEVQITEHRPVAMVSLGDLYLLDEDGEPFKRVQPSDALDLPIVTGIEREDYVARHDETVLRLTQALALAQSYAASAGKSAPLSEVHLELEGLTLVTAAGEQVQLGDDGWTEKLARLARVRQELKARALTASVIRLDNRARPASVTVSLQTNVSSARPERGERTGK